MNEKTKKILKGAGLTLGAVALLTLGFVVGACSAKAGTKQQTAITTPVAKSLIQRPKKVDNQVIPGTWQPRVGETITLNTAVINRSFRPTYTYGGLEYNYISCIEPDIGGGDIYEGNLHAGFARPKSAISITPTQSVEIHYFSDPAINPSIVAYQTSSGWSATGNITITNIDNVSNSVYLLAFLNNFYTKIAELEPEPETSQPSSSEPVTSEPETSQPESSYSIPDPIPLPETFEKVVLNSSYDFRRWFGNVDPTTGAIQFKLPTGASLVSVRVGGLTWENLGNERVYNCIEFTLQPFNSANSLVVSDGLAKTAQQLYGDKYNEFCMLSGVYYSYQSGYDGTYTTITDSALPSVDYRDRIYSMPMVSAQLDGTTENINALDIRNCVIPSVYRTFGISEDNGVVFSTNGYSSVTTRQLLGMDFSSVVNYSEGTASAFSLLTQAFGSVAGLLAVQVLPNITLGLLLFLPLIGAVIVLVIKAVKK